MSEFIEQTCKSIIDNNIKTTNVIIKSQLQPKNCTSKQIYLLKTISSDKMENKEKNPSISMIKSDVYKKRKSMLPEYKDLFTALFKLSDEKLRTKILDVINGHKYVEFKTIETQTDPVEIKSLSLAKEVHLRSIDSSKSITLSGLSYGNEKLKKIDNSTVEVAKKRKRKRKVSLPQANKESRAKQLLKMNKPKIIAENYINISCTSYSNHLLKRQRVDSIDNNLDISNMCEDMEANLDKCEQNRCLLENGLLPIQDAIVRNQTQRLSLQIKSWEREKMDLNELLTDEDEDLLQLAVLNTCDPSIVRLLLESSLNPNCLDAESNTIIHLAILNDIDVGSFELLMNHIDVKLLLTANDDGYTPLHLGVRQDRYLLVERLINILDKRLVKKIFYKRKIDELETDEAVLKKLFREYYEKICLNIGVSEDIYSCLINNHDLKQELLQAGDRRSGNTALYFAIDSRFEHLIYFLLAHLTDPRTENLSGQDCKTYFNEYAKSLNLSLKIDNTMEKVITLLS